MGVVVKPFEKAKVSLIQISNEQNIFILDFEKLLNVEDLLTFLINVFESKDIFKVFRLIHLIFPV